MSARFVVTRSRSTERPSPPPAEPRDAGSAPAPAGATSPKGGGCGCGGGRRAPQMPVVRLNGVEIAAERIGQESQNHPTVDAAASWTEAARALVVRELLLGEARRRGLAPDCEMIGQGRFETEEDSLIRQLLEEALEPSNPTREERRRVYEGLKDRFVTPTLFEASHILIEPEDQSPGGWNAAEARARALIGEVGQSREAFARAARAHSACPTANQDGSLGQIRRGELVRPVQDLLESLEEGRTAPEPVRTEFGWHVVRLERRIAGQLLPFEVVEPRIGDMLEARAWTLAASGFVGELARAAVIEGVEIVPAETGLGACHEGAGC